MLFCPSLFICPVILLFYFPQPFSPFSCTVTLSHFAVLLQSTQIAIAILGLAASILSTYLGNWVEGLERENLEIGITSGHVVVENLKLKRGALDDLQLPVIVKSGTRLLH